MSDAASEGTRSIRFRMVNRTTVIPEQVQNIFVFSVTNSMSLVAKYNCLFYNFVVAIIPETSK